MKKKLRLMTLAVFAIIFSVSTAWAAGLPPLSAQTYTNSIGIEFVRIPAGSFERETPKVTMTVTKPFYLGKYEITQEQWQAVMGNNPSAVKNPKNPVENVSWNDAQEFVKRLNKKEGTKRYRLPTAAEWELAARGGEDVKRLFFFMDNLTANPDDLWDDDAALQKVDIALDAYAWFSVNSGGAPHPVGQKKPNPYGLYDIYGNVEEWVQDWHTDTLPAGKVLRDYRGPATGIYVTLRGGGFAYPAGYCRSTGGNMFLPNARVNSFGFRLALNPK